MANTQTDVENEDSRTDEVQVEGEPANADETGDKPKTRAEKTAEKQGLTVDEFKKSKGGKLNERLDRIDATLELLVPDAEKQKLKAGFKKLELENVSFEDYEARYNELISIGADPEKAKAKIVEDLSAKAENQEKENRSSGKAKATLPPRADFANQLHKYQLLSKKAFSTLRQDKGIEYYQKYCKYCEDTFGKCWQD